ncbi:MAG: hypothetical protein R3B45_04140 [Bdellovibrionota bacterium]
MSKLIAENPDYIKMLRMHPGVTIYQTIASSQKYESVTGLKIKRQQFIASQPAYITSILNRVTVEYARYQKYERPEIIDISNSSSPFVHSAAGPYEIQLLNLYHLVQKSLEKYSNRINTKV